MNSEQAAEYTRLLAELSQRHDALLAEYVEPPFGERTMKASRPPLVVSAPGVGPRVSDVTLEKEFTAVGDLLSMTPPLIETEPGLWIPTAKGLLHGERQTDDPLSVRPMADDEILQPDQWAKWLADQEEPPSVKPFCPFVFNQAQNLSCASESVNAALCQVEVFSGQEPTFFNPLGTYHYVNGGRDSGSTLEDNIASLQTRGAFPEAVWPRSKGWRATPSAEALAEAKKHRLLELVSVKSKAEMGSRLIQRKGVYFWYDSHAVYATTLLSLSMFEYLNSWDKSWGNAGYGTMAFSSVSYNGFYSFGSTTDA